MATPGQCNRHALHLPCHDAPCSQIKLVGKICGRGFRQSRPSRTEPVRDSPWVIGTGHAPFDFSQCFYQPGSDCGHSVRTCPLHSSIPEGGPGRSWPNQATSAMAALSAISDRVAKSGKEGEKPCVQHSDDLLLRLCSQRRRRQLCFPAQRKPDGDGVVAVGAGAGSVLASEPACFSLLQLGRTTLGTMAILTMAIATLTPMAMRLTPHHTLTAMDIAALTTAMGITHAIDT